ncbi:hypothetical protein SAMN03159376_03735 [Pseudomonas sp. NFACC09-4]|nr:hypothetical protein SAMN03159376_03735 [Pseudomonas sp. NFACC09-4]SFX35198.1 hypothetical protein SAMN03159352_00972 [Pseudomonas sp. NFACC43]SFX85731.1 hypothetical protein SAMN03159390_02800 [Pseudomonas sp. NFACC49-2]SFY16370.1 hypothetical protein SAMN03159309_04331 [Pseudomonas sp. NFACC36]SIS08063.1 hypothetical protein SAMN05428955_1530 [Pseudomonas sp. 7SR1]
MPKLTTSGQISAFDSSFDGLSKAAIRTDCGTTFRRLHHNRADGHGTDRYSAAPLRMSGRR